MCGRLNISDLAGIRQMMADIGLPLFDDSQAPQPRFNVAPSATLTVCTPNGESVQYTPMHWGMPLPNGPLIINGRSETLAQKPTFRPIMQQRALIFANGFYEWQVAGRDRLGWHFQAEQQPALVFAAIWRQQGPHTQVVLLTTEANDCMQGIHARMPLLLPKNQALPWLKHDIQEHPLASKIKKQRVSSWVDDAKNQGPQCVAPAGPQPYTPDLFA